MGLISYWWRKYSVKNGCQKSLVQLNRHKTTLAKTVGAFIVLGLGLAAAVCAFGLELTVRLVCGYAHCQVQENPQNGLVSAQDATTAEQTQPANHNRVISDKVNALQTNVRSTYQNLRVCSDHSRLCQE